MFAKVSLVFAVFAASAQLAFAAPPSCLLDAINSQPNSADLKSICGKNAGVVKSAISSGCGSNTDLAMADFKKVCSGVTPSDNGGANSTSTSAPSSVTSGSGSGKGTIVYTSTYFDSDCTCTKTQVKTTTGAANPSGFPIMSAGSNSTVPTAPSQPSSPAAPSGGSSGSATSSGGVASSTGAASNLEISSFAGVAVAALGFALAL